MRFVRHYDLRKTRDTARWGFIYTGRNKWIRTPRNIDLFLGNHLFAFWGKKEPSRKEQKAYSIVTKVNNNGTVDVLPYSRRGES